MPKIQIYQWNQSLEKEFECSNGAILSEILIKEGIEIYTACNGKGSCKKCGIWIKEVQNKEYEKQWVLTCQYKITCDIEVFLTKEIEKGPIDRLTSDVSVLKEQFQKVDQEKKKRVEKEETVAQVTHVNKMNLAIDIGTTTLAFAILDNQSKEVLLMDSAKNPQTVYGLDVISRMQASNQGKKEILKEAIWGIIEEKTVEMLQKIKRKEAEIVSIVIAANTAMQHMLMGYSCETLSKAPFTPFRMKHDKIMLQDVFTSKNRSLQGTELILVPSASAFVGGDILSGLYAMDIDLPGEDSVLFLDLGTNGEMVYKKKNHFYATATAAGPALEAANITAGVAGIEGAICKVNIIANKIQIKTIGNKSPIGICGSGVIDVVYEFLKAGWIDASGAIQNEEFQAKKEIPLCKRIEKQDIVKHEKKNQDARHHGSGHKEENIVFTQEDIRQLQMAKAAIRSGMEILIEEAKDTAGDVKSVYLAGGLGYSLNVFKAAGIGLILPSFRQKTKAVGNTSLLGAMKYIQRDDGQKRLEALREQITTFNLAKNPKFEEVYIRNINF